MSRGVQNSIVIREIGLQYNFTGRITPASAPGNLGKQLKGTFRGAKVRKYQCRIRADNPNQRYAVNIMTLRNHLGADEYVKFPGIQPVQRAFKVFTSPHRVAIKPRNSRLREHAMEYLFQLFRSGPEKIHVLAATVSTVPGHGCHEAAIMAFHAMRTFVQAERNRAVFAFQSFAASPT